MKTEEVAQKVVELVRKQAWHEALDTLYDDNVVSVEAYAGANGSPETRGKEGVRGKIDWWVNAMKVHSFTANGPFVAHDRFVVQYDADVTEKDSNERRKISEVGVYTVKNGKIVREEFLPFTGKGVGLIWPRILPSPDTMGKMPVGPTAKMAVLPLAAARSVEIRGFIVTGDGKFRCFD